MSSLGLLANLVVDGLVTGCIYALIAIGFSLLWWVSNIIHLAHGGVLLIGGFALYLVTGAAGLPLPAGLLAALIATIFAGLVMDRFVYQPLHSRHTEELGLLTASLGVLIVVEYALVLAFGSDGTSISAGGMRVPLMPQYILVLDGYAIATITVTLAIFAGLGFLMHYTVAGKKLQAVAENPELARVLGIDNIAVGRYAAALGAALVMPAAAFLLYSTGIRPIEALHLVLVSAIVAIIGGRGSILGALLAGLLVGVAESAIVWFFDAGWRLMITFILLYMVLLLRPQGLLGSRS